MSWQWLTLCLMQWSDEDATETSLNPHKPILEKIFSPPIVAAESTVLRESAPIEVDAFEVRYSS